MHCMRVSSNTKNSPVDATQQQMDSTLHLQTVFSLCVFTYISDSCSKFSTWHKSTASDQWEMTTYFKNIVCDFCEGLWLISCLSTIYHWFPAQNFAKTCVPIVLSVTGSIISYVLLVSFFLVYFNVFVFIFNIFPTNRLFPKSFRESKLFRVALNVIHIRFFGEKSITLEKKKVSQN